MELKQIQVDKILANFYQPRVKFEKEGIKELAESILGNGLINPITVREWKDKFMIVAGERRWRAHKIAGLKTIQTFVKEYKSDGEWMVESLIENVHREDLTDIEKTKYLIQIMKIKKLKTNREVSKIVKIDERRIGELFDAHNIRKKTPLPGVSYTVIKETRAIGNEDLRLQVLKKAEKDKLGDRQVRPIVEVIKKAPEEVKEALLSDEISVEQAERISKLETEEQREKAIIEHKSLAMIDKGIERNIKNQMSAREKKEFDKGLIQAKNWIMSFRNSVSDSRSQMGKTIKILLISTKFIPLMDEKQKEKLEGILDNFIEILEQAEQLTNQIKDKL